MNENKNLQSNDDPELNALLELDWESREKELRKCAELTIESLERAAKIARIYIQYDKDIPKTGIGFFDACLEKIACRILNARTVLMCANKKFLLRKLEHVPLKDQLAIVNEEKTIPVAVIEDYQIVPKYKTISKMSNKEITRAFSGNKLNNGIRPIEEQKKFLQGSLKKAMKAKNKFISIDPKRYIKHAQAFVKDSDGNKVRLDDIEKAQAIWYKLPYSIQECFAKYAEIYRT